MRSYTVQRGDTLRGIALQFYGDPAQYVLIQEANNIANPNQISVGQVLEIPDEAGADNGLTEFHRAFNNGVRWRLTQAGVDIEGSGVERTPGQPVTITRIWEDYSSPVNLWAEHFNVPCAIILVTIATESEGNANAIRREPGYISDTATPHLISSGLMQTLLSTARGALHDSSINRDWLLNPRNSIQAGTAYIADQRARTLLDPPKAACAYNAGGIYENRNANNRWRMRQFPIGTSEHCDRFIKWFNDAVFVLTQHALQASVAYDSFYFG